MIILKTASQIELMREAGKITGAALQLGGEMAKEGVSLLAIDKKIRSFIESHGAKPSFLGYAGFPASACISVNSEVIHGIPDDRVLKNGDIVKIDVGAFYKGYHGDSANTFAVGEVTEEAKKLIEVTRQSFYDGVAIIKENCRIGDISAAIQATVEDNGFSVVRDFIGHGVGKNLHEEPDVPNFGRAGRGPRVVPGMTFAIEPMVCVGDYHVRTLENDWTVVTVDGSISAHYEHTIALTDNGVELLTLI
ncbi:MAG: type I methionyl aminopeptidase [Ruminococcaceae bacterium]|nr:type I methionyl aminopeptidase [Oscillospiraceae bacterium]